MGVPGSGPYRDLPHFHQLGHTLPQHPQVLSSKTLPYYLHAIRHGAGNGGPSLLCIPTDQTKLSHCALHLAHGYGTEYHVPPALSQVLCSEVLAFGVFEGAHVLGTAGAEVNASYSHITLLSKSNEDYRS